MRISFFPGGRLKRRRKDRSRAPDAPRPAGACRCPADPPAGCQPRPVDAGDLPVYLAGNENFPEDIRKSNDIVSMGRLLLEIGCGTADIAREIALCNPDIGVLATDRYDWRGPARGGSGYRRVALAWREKRLTAQQLCPENLVILRAEVDILHHLDRRCLDAVLMINPEPSVGASVLKALSTPAMYGKLKPGGRIAVLPFSREMGMMACGGLEFDHAPDWSRGLGFIMSSPLAFDRGPRRQWGVDLAASRYSLNSTQSDVYLHRVVHGEDGASPPP